MVGGNIYREFAGRFRVRRAVCTDVAWVYRVGFFTVMRRDLAQTITAFYFAAIVSRADKWNDADKNGIELTG